MKESKEVKRIKKGKSGITLIALVITIIVLLILAGISITMLTGNNSILNRATEANGKTEVAQLQEQAEIVRNGMLINKTTGLSELTQSELVAGIAADSNFKGSTISGNKVVTADGKYDIKVA